MPYSRQREVEDIATLVQEAGGAAFLVGLSSGAALALEAAASGLDIKKVAAYEPPYVDDGSHKDGAEHERQLKSLLAAGNRGGAVRYFHEIDGLGAEGLRASSHGVRLTFSGGTPRVRKGPFQGENELPAGFSLLRVGSLDEAMEWASRQAAVLGDVEIDIRPVTEAWDIGMSPKPDNVTTQRYMALRKATTDSEAGVPLSPKQQAEMARLIDETKRTGVHLATETLRPSARGRRYKNSRDAVRVMDGPFAESKELIAGYAIVSAESLEDAARWATRYIAAVQADEVDLRELEG